MKDKTLEKITFKSGNQAICHRELYEHNGVKIKIEIKSDSFKVQCYAKASALDGLEWKILYTIPAELMKTEDGLIYAVPYRNNAEAAEKEFQKDVLHIKDCVNKLL